MHVGAAERLVVGHFAGRHLHQRRTAEKDLGPVADHHHVITHAGDVRAACRRVTEYQREGRQPQRAVLGEVVEQLAPGHEDLGLRGQVRPARLDDVDDWQPVLAGNRHAPEHLAEGVGVRGSAAHRRVVRDDHRLDAFDDADADHNAAAHRKLRAPRRERTQFQEGRVGVEQQLDTLAGQHLSAATVPGDVLLAAARVGQRQLFGDRVELRDKSLAILEVYRCASVDPVGQDVNQLFLQVTSTSIADTLR